MTRPYQGIDTAAKLSAAAAQKLAQEGVSFAARYLVPNEGGTAWKALTASEAKVIRDAGLAVMLIWETSANRVSGGAKAGAEDGKTARKLAESMDVPAGCIIWFTADYNVPAADYDAVEAYLEAASMQTGLYRIGLYGHQTLVEAMAKRGYQNFWQCVAWSNEFSDRASVIQYEWEKGENARALAAKVGVGVDLDAALSLDGMWLPDKKSTEAEDAHKWCVSVGITDSSMRDVEQTEIMLWRYHKLATPEDDWSIGTKT